MMGMGCVIMVVGQVDKFEGVRTFLGKKRSTYLPTCLHPFYTSRDLVQKLDGWNQEGKR